MTFRQPDFASLEKQTFVETFKYKLIYVYTIDDKKHEGYLKVGDGSSTTIASVPTTDAPLSTTDKAGAATNAISAVTDIERVAHLLTAFGELRSDARKSIEIALKELLANASITAEAIAKKSGVSSRTIQRAIMSLVKGWCYQAGWP